MPFDIYNQSQGQYIGPATDPTTKYSTSSGNGGNDPTTGFSINNSNRIPESIPETIKSMAAATNTMKAVAQQVQGLQTQGSTTNLPVSSVSSSIDLSKIPTEILKEWSKQNPIPLYQQTQTEISKVPTEVLKQWAQQTPQQTPAQVPQGSGIVDKIGNSSPVEDINAFGGALPKALVEGVRQVGSLANDAIHTLAPESITKSIVDPIANALDSGFKTTEGFLTPRNPVVQQAQVNSPIATKAGNFAGETLGNMAAFGGIAKIANLGLTATMPGSSAVIKQTMKSIGDILTRGSPTLQSVGKNAALGSLYGATATPNDRVGGAISGGLVGGAVGAVTGAVASKIDELSSSIYRTIQQALDSGINPVSDDIHRSIVANIKNGGAVFKNLDIKKQIGQNVSDALDAMRPGNYNPALAPAENIAKQTIGNLENAYNVKNALYEPVNKSVVQAPAQNFSNMLSEVKDRLPKSVGLPQEAIPEQATLSNMLDYRKLLDGKISQANGQLQNATLSFEQTIPYQQLRNALQKDIQSTADKAGLGTQLAKADEFYHNEYLPFAVYNKSIGQMIDNPEAAADVWKTVSRQLNVPRTPDMNLLNKATKILGPQGQETIGYATIDNAFRRSFVGGQFESQTFASNISKMEKLGLEKDFYTPRQQSVIMGLKRATVNATRILKQEDSEEFPTTLINAIPHGIQWLLHTRPGIEAIKALGQAPQNTPAGRTLMNSFVHDVLVPVLKRELYKNSAQEGAAGAALNVVIPAAHALNSNGEGMGMMKDNTFNSMNLTPKKAVPVVTPKTQSKPPSVLGNYD